MAKKHRNILLNDVSDTYITNHQGSFVWEFNDYKKNISVKIKLDRWWIKFLANDLQYVVGNEQVLLDRLRRALEGK